MENKERQEYINQAVIVGRGMTSDLASDILSKMQSTLTETVKNQINGQLVEIKKTLNDQNIFMIEHFQKVDDHMKMDGIWKNTYTPYIKGLATISDSGKILSRAIIYIGSVVTALGIIYLAFKKWLN